MYQCARADSIVSCIEVLERQRQATRNVVVSIAVVVIEIEHTRVTVIVIASTNEERIIAVREVRVR